MTSPAAARLLSLPPAERADELEVLVVAEFRRTLMMADEEPLPLDESFFDIGFTSLRIAEVRDALQDLLGCEISTNVLFNSPTVAQLLAYLRETALPEVFGAAEPAATSADPERAVVDDVLADLYGR
jgi:acyl carrier protein